MGLAECCTKEVCDQYYLYVKNLGLTSLQNIVGDALRLCFVGVCTVDFEESPDPSSLGRMPQELKFNKQTIF